MAYYQLFLAITQAYAPILAIPRGNFRLAGLDEEIGEREQAADRQRTREAERSEKVVKSTRRGAAATVGGASLGFLVVPWLAIPFAAWVAGEMVYSGYLGKQAENELVTNNPSRQLPGKSLADLRAERRHYERKLREVAREWRSR